MAPVRVALLGSLDTKGTEYAYLAELIAEFGAESMIIDTSVLGEPSLAADVSAAEVAQAGGTQLAVLRSRADRQEAMTAMGTGAHALIATWVSAGELDAVLCVGGSNAAYVMAEACIGLPVGLGKIMVSTVASGNTRDYVRDTDLIMINSIVDINGLNRISRPILRNAARTAVALAEDRRGQRGRGAGSADKPLVGVTMFGVTTACGSAVAAGLSAQGFEPLTFHCTGVGGATLESLIDAGEIVGVADVTTTELIDDLVGGDCSAGPDRLTAAGRQGIPQVVSVGALDMINFWGRPVPEEFADRNLIMHNPTVTLMRTTAEESREVGRRLAAKLNAATGPVTVLFPTRGLSQLSVPGGPFEDHQADLALLEGIRSVLRPDLELEIMDTDINDPALATRAVVRLTELLRTQPTKENV